MINIGCNGVAEGGAEEPRSGFGTDALALKSRHCVE